MGSVLRHGSYLPPGGLVDALDRAGCLVVTGMFDHEMHESVQGELASHMATAVADDPPRTMGVYKMHRALGSCVGADQAR